MGWPARLGRQAPARSAHQVVVRGATSLAIVWQALWIAGDPTLWPWRAQLPVRAFALWVVVGTWAAVLATQVVGGRRARRASRIVNVAALAVVAVLALIAASRGTLAWPTASNLAVLTAGVGGMLLELRIAALTVTIVVAVETVAALAAPAITDLLYPGFALAVGVASISARAVLVREAHEVDVAEAASARREAERRVHEGVEAALRQRERSLHATVLNTLTAIERGGLAGGARERLSERCREAARVLRDLRRDAAPPVADEKAMQALDRDLASALADLRAVGTEVSVDVDPMEGLPPRVYAAVRAAVHESLANAVRHADARTCTVHARVRPGPAAGAGGVVVVVDDDGLGFDVSEGSGRFGLASAIAGPMDEIGGLATVESVVGAGTRVRLEWHGELTATGGRQFLPSASGVAVPILTAFGLFTTAAVATTIGQVGRPVIDVLALATLLGVYAVLMLASRRGTLPAWLVLVVVAGAAAAFGLQQMTEPQGDNTWFDWASVAVAMAFFVVAGVGPRWAWVVVIAAWLVLQGDPLHELVSAGTAVLVAGALFGRSARRNAAAVEQARAAERTQAIGVAVADASVRRLQARYAALSESDVVDLLDGVAEGLLSPEDPDVRRRAAVEERFVRSLIRIDPQADPVRSVVGEVVRAARRAGVALSCDIGDVPLRSVDGLSQLRVSLLAAMPSIVAGGEARLTARREEDDVVVRLFADIAVDREDEVAALAVPGRPVDVAVDGARPTLWEWRSAAASTAAERPAVHR